MEAPRAITYMYQLNKYTIKVLLIYLTIGAEQDPA